MKTINKTLISLCLLLLAVSMPLMVQAQRISFARADSLIAGQSHDLRLARLDVAAAEGQLAQSRRYDNPTVSMMYNVRNPNNRRWFDAGRDGELDVQLSHPFAIGGQHAEQVRQNQALVQASRSQLQVTGRDLRTQVHTLLINLYYQQRLFSPLHYCPEACVEIKRGRISCRLERLGRLFLRSLHGGNYGG